MLKIDWIALGIALVFIFFLYRVFYSFQRKMPELLFSSLALLFGREKTQREKFSSLPKKLFLGGMGMLSLAFIDPHFLVEEASFDFPPQEGLAFYLLLDRSGSMSAITGHEEMENSLQAISRFNRLQKAAISLIQASPNDLIGVIAFARAAEVISPLTLDHKMLEKRISNIGVVKDSNADGTSIGYAIYKASHLVASSRAFIDKEKNPPYQIKSAFLVVITDGFQDPNLLDRGNRLRTMELEEAVLFAKEKNIKIYIVNIDPKINEEKFGPNRREMQRAAESSGGKLIVADDLTALPGALKSILNEEKSAIYGKTALLNTKRISFFPYLIFCGLFLMAAALLLDATLLRKAL